MQKIYNTIASGFGLGYSRYMPGTLGTILGIPFFYFFSDKPIVLVLLGVFLFFIGINISSKVSTYVKKKDPSLIVIDEVVGFIVSCLFIKFSFLNLLIIFVLFRFFDILKPYPIKQLEKLPKGLGIMADDVMAGIYANLVFWVLSWLIY